MEHQKIKVMIRSKKTTMMPMRALLTSMSSPPTLIVVAEHVARIRYFQFLDLAVDRVQESTGKSDSLNSKEHFFLPLHC